MDSPDFLIHLATSDIICVVDASIYRYSYYPISNENKIEYLDEFLSLEEFNELYNSCNSQIVQPVTKDLIGIIDQSMYEGC